MCVITVAPENREFDENIFVEAINLACYFAIEMFNKF